MELVIDANVLFAALIKEGTSAEMLFQENLRLYAPEFIFVEMHKHREEILRKTNRSAAEFEKLLELFERRILLIPLDELKSYNTKAKAITPDPDDAAYFALALRNNIPIWSNDKSLKEQKIVTVYNTAEVLKMLDVHD